MIEQASVLTCGSLSRCRPLLVCFAVDRTQGDDVGQQRHCATLLAPASNAAVNNRDMSGDGIATNQGQRWSMNASVLEC